MTTVAEYVTIARDYLRDPARFFSVTLTGHGLDQAYELPQLNVNPTGLVVQVDGSTIASTDYTLYSRDGFIRFDTPPADGDVVLIEGTYWEWVTDDDFGRFVGYALDEFNTSEGEDDFEDSLDENSDLVNVVALNALVEVLWSLWTEAARDIDVSSPEVNIPARQRFQQLEMLIDRWSRELGERSQMLNIGRSKIEVLALRRVSRTTGRLVPVYRSQEIEERSKPERVMLPIPDLTAGTGTEGE